MLERSDTKYIFVPELVTEIKGSFKELNVEHEKLSLIIQAVKEKLSQTQYGITQINQKISLHFDLTLYYNFHINLQKVIKLLYVKIIE